MNFFRWLFYSLFGTPSERTLKRYKPTLDRINAFEEQIKSLPDSAFPEKTAAFKAQLKERLEPLMQDLPEDEDERKDRNDLNDRDDRDEQSDEHAMPAASGSERASRASRVDLDVAPATSAKSPKRRARKATDAA